MSARSNEGIGALLAHVADCEKRIASANASVEIWAHRLRQKLRNDLLSDLPAADLLARHAKSVSEKIEDPDSAIIALKAEWLAHRNNVY